MQIRGAGWLQQGAPLDSMAGGGVVPLRPQEVVWGEGWGWRQVDSLSVTDWELGWELGALALPRAPRLPGLWHRSHPA